LIGRGFAARRAVRRAEAVVTPGADVVVGEIGPTTDWRQALQDVDAVIHLAARAHVMRDAAVDPLADYRRVNVLGTRGLARAAADAGVRRMIFLSSIKVNGEKTAGKPYSEQDPPRPQDAYGVSKWEAEQMLRAIAADSHMEAVVLRPPLLYGPGVKGNFLGLMRVIDRGLPLPLASIHNRRSLLYIGSLIDAIMLCLNNPMAAGKTYLLADSEDVSTPALIRGIASALGKPARLLPFPPALLKFAGALAGKTESVSRLLGSLQIDASSIRRELDWQPCADMARGLAETARWYHQHAH
jgi:nucleoside-diphosphate-sugar epimerase